MDLPETHFIPSCRPEALNACGFCHVALENMYRVYSLILVRIAGVFCKTWGITQSSLLYVLCVLLSYSVLMIIQDISLHNKLSEYTLGALHEYTLRALHEYTQRHCMSILWGIA